MNYPCVVHCTVVSKRPVLRDLGIVIHVFLSAILKEGIVCINFGGLSSSILQCPLIPCGSSSCLGWSSSSWILFFVGQICIHDWVIMIMAGASRPHLGSCVPFVCSFGQTLIVISEGKGVKFKRRPCTFELIRIIGCKPSPKRLKLLKSELLQIILFVFYLRVHLYPFFLFFVFL